jgi:hypothetical protein
MFSASTIYRSGARTVEVLPGESHSDAWAYITRGGPEPASYPCTSHPGAGRVRVRTHSSRRRQPHRRRAAIPVP